MPEINISEASRLPGVSRKTIQRYIAQGKLSATIDGTGGRTNKRIEISELMSVFGNLSHPAHATAQGQCPSVSMDNVAQGAGEIDALKMVLSAKNETIHILSKQVDGLQIQLAQVTRLLEYRKPEASAGVQKQIAWWMIIGIGSMSAILIVITYFFSHGYRLWFML
jgi:hypothetical protein